MHGNTLLVGVTFLLLLLLLLNVSVASAKSGPVIDLTSPGLFSTELRDSKPLWWGSGSKRNSFGDKLLGYRWSAPLFSKPLSIDQNGSEVCAIFYTGNAVPSDLTNYQFSWMISGLPAVDANKPGANSLFAPISESGEMRYLLNFWLFFVHVQITKTGVPTVIGVEARPKSVGGIITSQCQFLEHKQLPLQPSYPQVTFAFQTKFVRSENANSFLGYRSSYSNWWGFVNGSVIFALLAIMSALVVLRIKKSSIVMRQLQGDDIQEEAGWKIVRYDIFRRPNALPLPLALCLGIGSQLLLCFGLICVLVFARVISTFNPPAIVLWSAVLFSLTGFANGFFSARAYRLMGCAQYWLWCLGFSSLLPGALLLSTFILMTPFWGAFPFLEISAMWIFAHAPLSLAGGYVAMKVLDPVLLPVGVSEDARAVPLMVWYLDTKVLILLGGALPFGTIISVANQILACVWLRQYFFDWGHLLFSFIYFVGACGCVSVVLVYCQLCCEDYRWWWRSFLFAASSGMYFFFYSTYFAYAFLVLDSISAQVSFAISNLLVSACIAMLAGSIGFYSNLFFLMRIYSDAHFS